MPKKVFFLFAAAVAGIIIFYNTGREEPIKVGILHSLSGMMSISEKAVADATLLAIEELNADGGLLGRRVVPVIADGASDDATFEREARRLINSENVDAIFGCWTSSSRKKVKEVVEASGNILFYPVQYEGLETSPNIIYLGAVPNQQIYPAIFWAMKNIGAKMYLIGSDYIFPRAASEIIKHQLQLLEGTVAAERYVPLGSGDFDAIVQEIKALSPDVIINTINGESNIHFFKALHKAGITSDKIPSLSFSIGENELQGFRRGNGEGLVESMNGHYASWNYFQSITSEANNAFVEKFKKRFGPSCVISDPMEDAYSGVHLWAQAVADAGSSEPKKVLDAIKKQSFAAPEGIINVDPQNNHLWKTVRIGRMAVDGQFEIVWSSQHPIKPVPFLSFKDAAEWTRFLDDIYKNWGDSWAAPEEMRP